MAELRIHFRWNGVVERRGTIGWVPPRQYRGIGYGFRRSRHGAGLYRQAGVAARAIRPVSAGGGAPTIRAAIGGFSFCSTTAVIRIGLWRRKPGNRGSTARAEKEEQPMRSILNTRKRAFVLVTSVLVTLSMAAPAAAWAEMIVKPGH
jgi:hypothetical protein